MSEPTPDRWHLKREIQIGHLITTLTVAAAALVYIQKIEQRVALLEAATAAQQARDERQDTQSKDTALVLRAQLDRLEGKIDRLIETKR